MLIPNHTIVKEYLRRIIGEKGLRIMEDIPEGGEITDEEIVEISNDVKLTEVRKMLYVLYENRIAEYRTEKDDESGWITYLWRFNIGNIEGIVEEEVEKALENLKTRYEYENNGVFYICKCRRVLFEETAACNFVCDICNSNFEYFDNTPIIKAIEDKIEKIEEWRRKGKRKRG